MEPSIGIYQPFFKPALLERLDRGFIALDWLSNPAPALRELAIHRHIAAEKIYSRHQLTGLLSAKFFSKTKLKSHIRSLRRPEIPEETIGSFRYETTLIVSWYRLREVV